MWPFRKRTEKRQDGTSYTDVVTRALVAAATGEEVGSAAGTAALETAVALYARCFAGATIAPVNERTRAITPTVLAHAVRETVARGEAMYLLRVIDGMVKLFPCGSWDIRGGDDPGTWTVQVDTFGPTSSSTTRNVSYSDVLHFRWSHDSALPWVGVGPDARASVTGRLHGAGEQTLAHELGGPVGGLLPVPQGQSEDGEDDPIAKLTADIRELRGRVALPETVRGGWGEGEQAAPAGDWKLSRIGPAPTAGQAELRKQSAEAVMAAAGVPAAMFAAGGDAAGRREAFRLFYHTGLLPLARAIEEECRGKLDQPDFAIDLSALGAADIQGRSRSYAQLRKAGMSKKRAARVTGLL